MVYIDGIVWYRMGRRILLVNPIPIPQNPPFWGHSWAWNTEIRMSATDEAKKYHTTLIWRKIVRFIIYLGIVRFIIYDYICICTCITSDLDGKIISFATGFYHGHAGHFILPCSDDPSYDSRPVMASCCGCHWIGKTSQHGIPPGELT